MPDSPLSEDDGVLSIGDGWVDVMRSMLRNAPKESFANACLVIRMGLRKAIHVSKSIVTRYERLVSSSVMGTEDIDRNNRSNRRNKRNSNNSKDEDEPETDAKQDTGRNT